MEAGELLPWFALQQHSQSLSTLYSPLKCLYWALTQNRDYQATMDAQSEPSYSTVHLSTLNSSERVVR